MIYEIRDVNTGQFWLGVIFGSVTTLLIVLSLERLMREPSQNVQLPADVISAYNMGIKDALKTNPPSLDLENTCASLWFNKQGK